MAIVRAGRAWPLRTGGGKPPHRNKNQKSTRMARAMRVFTFYVNISRTY